MALNTALIIALLVVVRRAKERIKEEKLATFAGCLGAITDGIANKDQRKSWELVAAGLSQMRGGIDREEVHWRLVRAGVIRLFRVEPTAADIGGEHTRALVHQAFRGSRADEVWAYIDGALDGRHGFGEPAQKFSQKELAEAQFQLESEVTGLYARAIGPSTLKLFG